MPQKRFVPRVTARPELKPPPELRAISDNPYVDDGESRLRASDNPYVDDPKTGANP